VREARGCEVRVKLGGFTLLRPNTAAMSCCFVVAMEPTMNHSEQAKILPVVQFSSIVVLDESQRILLVLQAAPELAGLWNTPGGGSEPGESPVVAARRELYEETGLQGLELVFIDSVLWRGDRGDLLLGNIFLTHVHSSVSLKPVASEEILEARWSTKSEFDEMYKNGKIRTYFTKLFVESALKFVQNQSVGEPT
jgi:8-oxo-dGTP pyrophosphatase MutT (NUDIX family)